MIDGDTETVVASRIFESDNGPVEIRIFRPTDDGDVWRCKFEVERAGKVLGRRAAGQDSLQALLLAIAAARVDALFPAVGERDQSLRLDGNEDLMLEVPQFDL